jgi:chromosome partitioning protein
MKTLVVLSQKGGSGKSTLTVHLAVSAVQSGLKTAILDIDHNQASSLRWNDIRSDNHKIDTAKCTAKQLHNYLQMAEKGGVDLVLVDTAPHSNSDAVIAAQLADFILIPCRPALFDLEAIFNTIQIAKATGHPYSVIINAAPRGKLAEETRSFLERNNVPVLALTVYQRAAYSHALLDGRSVHEYEPERKAASEITELYEYISAELKLKRRLVA